MGSMPPEADALYRWVDRAPIAVVNQARDYLRDERLNRRVHMGALYTAELMGYQDRYHPAVDAGTGDIRIRCGCERRMPCAHAVALLLDLARPERLYPELSWRIRPHIGNMPTFWLLDQRFPWDRIPAEVPAWRYPPGEKGPDWLTDGDPSLPVERDPAAEIWADMHPAWLSSAAVQERVQRWRDRRIERGLKDPEEWAALAWFQPGLPLDPVWIHWGKLPHVARALATRLFSTESYWVSTPERRRIILRSLTLVSAEAAPLWNLFRHDDPDFLAEAEAYYLAGDPQAACRLLEEHLPTSFEARQRARARLIAWLPPAEALPHRLAQALETGSREWLNGVAEHMPRGDWERFNRAFQERWPVSR
ncbi:hypothetical protein [Sulfobacillus harzensis]|uniref:SWIM-type domain-containing protein n=1 Tax=Sulfobacillus harzensis TaxID=2729629 RepID=A0A7Y0L5U2_9FIRM|nr:hypothetical protein [Sulfobacillus harzensis]NMP22449.1 hypothetical protein [Sulfobacillus harzensis]